MRRNSAVACIYHRVICVISLCFYYSICFTLLSIASDVNKVCHLVYIGMTTDGYSTDGNQAKVKIICENLGALAQVPYFPPVLNGTDELTFRTGTTITTIQAGAFANLGLRRLTLVRLAIKVVDRRAFAGLETTLEYLNLASNEIQSLDRETFVALENLQTLIVCWNLLYDLPNGLLGTRQSLDYIDLSGNRISFAGKSTSLFLNQTFLQTLILGGNVLRTLRSEDLQGLSDLRTLDLSRNGLSDVNQSTFRYVQHLMGLSLRGNNLRSISASLCYFLQYLIELDLSSNEVVLLSADAFSRCPALKVLNMSNNRLTDLPDASLGVLQELSTLDLSRNNMSAIRSGHFRNLRLLERLDLSCNNIKDLLFDAFMFNGNLRSLNLSSNNISFLKFNTTNRLEYFDLSLNAVDFSGVLALSGLFQLRSLNLSGNRLEGVVPDGFLLNQSLLEVLDLSFNYISRVGTRSFSGLVSLGQLRLDNNRLVSLSTDAFLQNIRLSVLWLSRNQLKNFSSIQSRSIRVLRANDNNMSSVLYPQGITALEELYLGNNAISAIDSIANNASGFRLKILDLSSNRLNALNLTALLSDLPSLEILNVSGNFILEVQAENVSKASSRLGVLDLTDNCLETFNHVDGVYDRLSRLSLAHNPLICSCDVSWLMGLSALENPNGTVCTADRRTTKERKWINISCNPGTNCSLQNQSKSVNHASCSMVTMYFPKCFLDNARNSSDNNTDLDPTSETPVNSVVSTKSPNSEPGSASRGSPVPAYVYILSVIVGLLFLVLLFTAVLILIRKHRRKAFPVRRNDHSTIRTVPLPAASISFDFFKIPKGRTIGRPTSFDLGWLNFHTIGRNRLSKTGNDDGHSENSLNSTTIGRTIKVPNNTLKNADHRARTIS